MGHLSPCRVGAAGGTAAAGSGDGRAAEPHRLPRAREHALGGWGGSATTRVVSPRGPRAERAGQRGRGTEEDAAPTCSGRQRLAVTCGGGGGGGGGGSRGGEGASFRKGWDLPARPLPPQRGRSPTYSGVPAAGPRVDGGAPRSRLLPPPVPGCLLVIRGRGRGWTVQQLPSKAKVDAFAWRSSHNKRQNGTRDPPPAGYLFLTCCNLPAGSFLSTHLGLCTQQLGFIFRPASPV